jgi:hypothetical protein
MNHLHNDSVDRSAMTSSHAKSLLVAGAAALALLATSLPAAADAPSQAQVQKARGECAMHKRKVAALEAKGADEQTLAKARLDWEHACAQASELMAASGKQ